MSQSNFKPTKRPPPRPSSTGGGRGPKTGCAVEGLSITRLHAPASRGASGTVRILEFQLTPVVCQRCARVRSVDGSASAPCALWYQAHHCFSASQTWGGRAVPPSPSTIARQGLFSCRVRLMRALPAFFRSQRLCKVSNSFYKMSGPLRSLLNPKPYIRKPLSTKNKPETPNIPKLPKKPIKPYYTLNPKP